MLWKVKPVIKQVLESTGVQWAIDLAEIHSWGLNLMKDEECQNADQIRSQAELL